LCGLSGLAAGMAIELSEMLESALLDNRKALVGMILILIFAEALGLTVRHRCDLVGLLASVPYCLFLPFRIHLTQILSLLYPTQD
jgi:hypothetical protein